MLISTRHLSAFFVYEEMQYILVQLLISFLENMIYSVSAYCYTIYTTAPPQKSRDYHTPRIIYHKIDICYSQIKSVCIIKVKAKL